MIFVEFLEFIGRIAENAIPNPSKDKIIKLDKKIDAILGSLLRLVKLTKKPPIIVKEESS